MSSLGKGTVPEGGKFLPKERSDFNVALDFATGEFSVDLRSSMKTGPASAHLNLKDWRGRKAVLDLSSGAAREIRKKLDAFFVAERAIQEARLA